MEKLYIEQIKLPIFIYDNPAEYAALFTNEKELENAYFPDKEHAFVTKNPNELYILIDINHWDVDNIRETIGHELGHFQNKIIWFINDENKANYFMKFVLLVEEITNLICDIITNI